jgi:hypothetical protein
LRSTSRIGLGAGVLDPLERRGLVQPQPHEQPDGDQDGAEQERDPPAPGQERLVRGDLLDDQEHDRGQEQAGGHAHLRPAAEEAAPALRGVLDRHEHRPAPLAADADALGDAQHHQQDRGPDADGVIGRHQPDEEGRHPHDEQRQHQHGLAPDPVAEVTEDDPPERPGREADPVGGQGQQGARGRLGLGEEQLVEHQGGGGAVEEEVLPLDGGADEARRHHLPDGAPLGGLVAGRRHRATSLLALQGLISAGKSG